MATIDNLPVKSITDMTEAELLDRIRQLRNNRLETKATAQAEAKPRKPKATQVKVGQPDLSSMSSTQAASLISMLEALMKKGTQA